MPAVSTAAVTKITIATDMSTILTLKVRTTAETPNRNSETAMSTVLSVSRSLKALAVSPSAMCASAMAFCS